MDRVPEIDLDNPVHVEHELNLRLGTRHEQRAMLVETFLAERENSRYSYRVEQCNDGTTIVLARPTWLNKGFDFQVRVISACGSVSRPSHEDVLDDLADKKKESADHYKYLRQAIDSVFQCEEPDEVLRRLPADVSFQSGMSVEILLKALKWLFIEQDLTYWNYSGRRKLMNEGILPLDDVVPAMIE